MSHVPEDSLSTEIINFLRINIKSIEQLEILAAMRREPLKEWSTSSLFREIRSNENSITNRLMELVARKIVLADTSGEGVYTYNAKDTELDHIIQAALDMYATRPAIVLETIYRPDNSMQTFADAFKIRKQ